MVFQNLYFDLDALVAIALQHLPVGTVRERFAGNSSLFRGLFRIPKIVEPALGVLDGKSAHSYLFRLLICRCDSGINSTAQPSKTRVFESGLHNTPTTGRAVLSVFASIDQVVVGRSFDLPHRFTMHFSSRTRSQSHPFRFVPC